jgi:hypothetical protein
VLVLIAKYFVFTYFSRELRHHRMTVNFKPRSRLKSIWRPPAVNLLPNVISNGLHNVVFVYLRAVLGKAANQQKLQMASGSNWQKLAAQL